MNEMKASGSLPGSAANSVPGSKASSPKASESKDKASAVLASAAKSNAERGDGVNLVQSAL